MKRRILSLLTVAALLCALLSTTALARETDVFDAWPEDVDFNTLTCGPADAGALYALLEELEGACALPDNEAQVLELMDQAGAAWDELNTRYAVCIVAYYRDPVSAAQDYLDWSQLLLEAQNAYLQAERQVLQSQYGKAVAQAMGMDQEELLAMISPDDQKQQELMSRDQELINDYWTAMAQDYQVTWQGQSWTQGELNQADSLSVEEIGEIQRLLDEARNAAAASILGEMVEVRSRYAQSKGYDNYADYAYEQMYYRDYTLDDARRLYAQVKEEIVPLLIQMSAAMGHNEALSQDLLSPYVTDLTQEEQLDLVEPYLDRISSEYADLFRYMRENHLADIGPLDTKLDVGFTTSLPAYRSAVLFNCPSGGYYDVESLFHEFGHYAEFCLSDQLGGGFECVDVAEIDSQGLELLSLDFADEMFPQGGAVYRGYVLAQLLNNVVSGCMLDEFQAALYADGEMTVAEMNALMTRLLEEYGGLDMFGTNSDYNWVQVNHTFESPMYYISYATSALSALELFLDAQTDFDGAADTYLGLVERGTGLSYREAVQAAGLGDIFQTGTVAVLAQELQNYLLDQVYDLSVPRDLDGHWAEESMLTCAAAGLLQGDGAGNFLPDSGMTRSQVVTLLWRLAGCPEVQEQAAAFADVPGDAWYAEAVAWAAQSGIVGGVDSSRFDPDGAVTREQLAAMLGRMAGYDGGLTGALNGFADSAQVSSWAAEGTDWAVSAGLLTGKPGGLLDPQGVLSRGEIAALTVRLLLAGLV